MEANEPVNGQAHYLIRSGNESWGWRLGGGARG